MIFKKISADQIISQYRNTDLKGLGKCEFEFGHIIYLWLTIWWPYTVTCIKKNRSEVLIVGVGSGWVSGGKGGDTPWVNNIKMILCQGKTRFSFKYE